MLFKIINTSRSTVLADKAKLAQTFLKRLKGLLGTKTLNPKEGLILRPGDSIHTFFMHYPIDVIFVDKNNCVLYTIKNLKPCRFSPIVWRSQYVIELPVGIIELSFTQKGDLLRLESL